ncbi:MAG: Fic family protein [Microthrixaceae bacterium]
MLNTATRYCTEQIRALATGPNPGRDQLPARLSLVLSDMNEAHPFREGNGRTQRTLLGQIAEAHGARLDWALISPEENLAASKAAGSDEYAFTELLTRVTHYVEDL